MMWVLRVALCATLAVATAPQAYGETARDAAAAHPAASRSTGVTAKADAGRGHAVTRLELSGATKAVMEALLQGAVAGERPVLIGGHTGGLGGGRAHGAFGEASKWTGGGSAGLRYAVSSTVSVGLNYRRVTEEDLSFEVAETGSLESDYDSHNFVLQARWEF